jgi:hypothetical protein
MSLVRLGFVVNFARYVEWPEATLKVGEPILICMAPGDVSMAEKLDELTKQTVHNRRIRVRRLSRPEEIGDCKVLYLPAELPTAMPDWLSAAKRGGALTVSDLPDFVDMGGMIGLVSVNGRYRFDINLGKARNSNLKISAYIFKLARTVK